MGIGINVGPVEKIFERPLIQVVGTADSWQDWAKLRGAIEPPPASFFVDSHGMAVDLAKSGAGIALTSLTIAAPCINDGALLLAEPERRSASDGYHLTIDPGVSSELPAKFADWLVNEVAQSERPIMD